METGHIFKYGGGQFIPDAKDIGVFLPIFYKLIDYGMANTRFLQHAYFANQFIGNHMFFIESCGKSDPFYNESNESDLHGSIDAVTNRSKCTRLWYGGDEDISELTILSVLGLQHENFSNKIQAFIDLSLQNVRYKISQKAQYEMCKYEK